jgi:hypothetical protein
MTLANNLDECHEKALAILKHCCAKHMDDAAFENMVYAVNFQITRAWSLGTKDCLTNLTPPPKNKK